MLNHSQQIVFNQAIEWWNTKNSQTFEISGPPGSGKTFLINEIIDSLGIDRDRIAPMAYTGAAAINMRTKGMYNAKTCFSWLYRCFEVPVLKPDGTPVYDKVFNKPKTRLEFVPISHLSDIDLIIVDESGMITPEMRKVIDSMNLPVLAVGDLNQLPPITGSSGYLNNPSTVHTLNEIVRQESSNTIIQFSQMALRGLDIPIGHHGNVYVIYDDQLNDEIIKNSQIIICSRNSTRDEMISRVRNNILGIRSNLPVHGERLVCRKNNWEQEVGGISLTNGLLGNVINYPDASSMDLKNLTYKLSFKPDIIPEAFINLDADYRYLLADHKTRNDLKNSKYSFGDKFEFGYAITTHMSQGSEFDNGIYIEEYLRKDINNRLHYVGLTRFKRICVYVKHRPKKYYNGIKRV